MKHGGSLVRVMHVITGLTVGGAETMLLNLLSATDKSRIEPSVVSLLDGGALAPRVQELGVGVRSLAMRAGFPSLRALFALREAIREFRPRLIQGWMYHGNLAASIGSIGLPPHVPVVWGIHHSLYSISAERPMTRAVIRLGSLLSSRPEAIVYVSKTSAVQHQKAGFNNGRSWVIPNGFDCDLFQPDPDGRMLMRDRWGVRTDDLLIGHLGRWHPVKDHANLLRAFAKVAVTRRNMHLVLAGTGLDSRNKELIETITTLGLSGRVNLLGERADIPAVMAALDVVCSSSSGEAFPMAIGEAMSCAVPCVVTDVGDSARIVGETGRVVPPSNPDALAAAIVGLLDMPAAEREALGRAARARVRENFSLHAVVRQYESLYESILSGD